MNQPTLSARAMNSHTGMPHRSTLRNPGLYTASVMTTARKNQTMQHRSPVRLEGKDRFHRMQCSGDIS